MPSGAITPIPSNLRASTCVVLYVNWSHVTSIAPRPERLPLLNPDGERVRWRAYDERGFLTSQLGTCQGEPRAAAYLGARSGRCIEQRPTGPAIGRVLLSHAEAGARRSACAAVGNVRMHYGASSISKRRTNRSATAPRHPSASPPSDQACEMDDFATRLRQKPAMRAPPMLSSRVRPRFRGCGSAMATGLANLQCAQLSGEADAAGRLELPSFRQNHGSR